MITVSKISRKRIILGYTLLVLLPVLSLLFIIRSGGSLKAPPNTALALPAANGAIGVPQMPDLFLLILQISVILFASRVVGKLFLLIGQPRVVGEMTAGIILGPSVLGWLAPNLFATIFPAFSLGYLNALSQVGLVLFMFLIGLALNPNELKNLGHAAVTVSNASISLPFLLGGALAVYLYPRFSNSGVAFVSFALFLGAAMSITAFPVLARILKERNLLNTRLGTIAIACAAVDDVTGWCVLAGILVLIRSHGAGTPLWLTVGGTIVFAAFVIYAGPPLLRHFETRFRRNGALDDSNIAVLTLLVLTSALITERLGIHLLFGAFLLGTVMPREQKFVRHLLDKFESVVIVLLLPLFFAFSGLRTSIGLVQGREMWLCTGLITLVAVTGKLGGSMLAARACGIEWREATGLGILMNTRGLMELVILNIGLDIKVITPALFSMMVIMALATTFMTTPLLELVCPAHWMKARELQQVRSRATV
jgi:Kef-type K+ transport system membrane component KefB